MGVGILTCMTVKNRAAGLERMKRTKTPTLILETKGDFYLAVLDLPSYHTFRIFNQSGEILRGVYYSDSKRGYTFLHRHENMADVFSTTEHENIHAAIDQCREWELDDLIDNTMISKHELHMDDNEEHNGMRIAIWEEEYFGE